MKVGGSDRSGPAAMPDDNADANSTEGAPAPPAGMTGEPGPLLRIVHDQRVAFLIVGGINTVVIVGGINTVVGFAWFIGFQLLLQDWLGYMVVLLCAHVASVLCAFVLYRRFVFRVRGHGIRISVDSKWSTWRRWVSMLHFFHCWSRSSGYRCLSPSL